MTDKIISALDKLDRVPDKKGYIEDLREKARNGCEESAAQYVVMFFLERIQRSINQSHGLDDSNTALAQMFR